jgi:S-adenosylmethionine:tRNA ribosyltransferase-isomerase
MRVGLFDFDLPPERIAYTPANPRDSAKLLHVSETLNDRIVRDLPALLNPGDMIVFNDSKVIPARLFTQVNGKQIEVLLHKRISSPSRGELWSCFAKPAKKLKAGMVVHFAADFCATVEGRSDDGQVILKFEQGDFFTKLGKYGHMPLPPYIERADNTADKTSYQTIYARAEGSVAAPTAGLHFTPDLMAALDARGVKKAYVTLHVGAGTFQPVKVDDTDQHVMHHEWYEISQATADAINQARSAGGKVIAVGTTSLRILESVADDAGILRAASGETDIFITPGYRFKIVDRLMTNFHLPKSTLFMLVSAFAGLERMQTAYQHAIANQYRFYSYGDACLLERAA